MTFPLSLSSHSLYCPSRATLPFPCLPFSASSLPASTARQPMPPFEWGQGGAFWVAAGRLPPPASAYDVYVMILCLSFIRWVGGVGLVVVFAKRTHASNLLQNGRHIKRISPPLRAAPLPHPSGRCLPLGGRLCCCWWVVDTVVPHSSMGGRVCPSHALPLPVLMVSGTGQEEGCHATLLLSSPNNYVLSFSVSPNSL